MLTKLRVRARVRVHQERPYRYDKERGLWLYRQVGEDEEAGNIVTNAGLVAIHTYIYGTSAQRTVEGLSGTGFNYIALSNDTATPAASDTSLTGELSGNGLTRAAGSVSLPVGATTVTVVSHAFTYTGVSQGVRKTALFDTSSSGKMAHEIQFTQRVLVTNDVLTLTFSITIS
jgi:hypothetical protein